MSSGNITQKVPFALLFSFTRAWFFLQFKCLSGYLTSVCRERRALSRGKVRGKTDIVYRYCIEPNIMWMAPKVDSPKNNEYHSEYNEYDSMK